MKVGMVVAGVAFLGIGGAGAWYVPPLLAEAAAERAGIPALDAASAKAAKVGDKLLLHGTLTKRNEPFEKGLVVGHKQVYGISAKRHEREAHRHRVARREDSGTKTLKWWPAEEFKRLVHVAVDGVGEVALSPHSGVVGGDVHRVEEKVGPETFRWEGARRGDRVSAYVRVTGTEPLEVETQMGDTLFVGAPDALQQANAKGDRFVLYAIYGLFGVFGLIGLITLGVGVVRS